MTQSFPMTAGPLMTLPAFTTLPASMRTRPSIRAPFSTVPSMLFSRSSKTRWLASKMSSGLPVSFHQSFTMCALTRPPCFLRPSMASVISSSSRHEGFNSLIIGKMLSLSR